jgi:threonine/homoserine/homoserine lactone efflux protein
MLDAINWDTYWLYVATEAALSLSPGPAVLLVVATGMTLGAGRSIYAALGILSANALYFALSATALGALLIASPGFFRAVQWLGAGYLVWIGVRALLGHPTPLRVADAGARASHPAGIWLAGLTLQLANPKTLIFFAAILPQFVAPARPVGAQMLWLAAGSIVPEFFILAAYGWLGARAAGLMGDERYALWTERAAGVLVLVVAALVLSVNRA